MKPFALPPLPALGCVAVLCLALPAMAADGNARAGKQIFDRYCAACHGKDGHGDGPMRAVLTLQPADLTRLSRDNGGTFPMARVVERIDGRDPMVAHGSPMPIYGDFFEGKDVTVHADDGRPVLTTQPVADLLEYLRSLQGH